MVDRQRWLFEQFAAKFAAVTGSMLGSEVTATLDSQSAQAGAELLSWEQSFDAGEGRLTVAAPEVSWERIGGEALKAAGVDELDRDSVRGTYLELLSQGLSGVASEIGALLGKNVSATNGAEKSGQVSQAIRVVVNGEPVLLFAGVEASLVALLSAVDAPPAPPPAPAATEGQPEHIENSKTLGLLMDVELPVSVSFGRASVPLKDVIKLTSGSVVELNRGVAEPVELIVNNCVIARGEVVVVEGNYGVRIQQIISPRERLRTLS